MKKLCLILLLIAFCACSSNREDEQLIEQVVLSFYKSIDKKDYKNLEELLSPNMRYELSELKNYSNEMTSYTSVNVSSINIVGEKAVVSVTATDEFGNTVMYSRNLIKINGKWFMNDYNALNAGSPSTK